MSVTTSKLLLKSMPCTMSEFGELIQELKLITPRSLNAFGRRRVLIEYADAPEAQAALEQLLGLSDILDKPLRVCSFGPRQNSDDAEWKVKPTKANKSTQAAISRRAKDTRPQQEQEINKYVQKLYACNNQCDFMQPPPPYLRYAYPPIDADILANINDALQSDKRFYTQVLHLMNRMNLSPPFGPRSAGFNLKATQNTHTIATQTETIASESESELESESEHVQLRDLQLKRPRASVITEQYRKRARQLIQLAARQASRPVETTERMDMPTSSVATWPHHPKIELKLPSTLPSVASSNKELPLERMSVEELELLAVYNNYKQGEPSNKLYIKNLDKSVTESQLRAVYARYAPADSLDIKVMQQGRMKGQAFVTFQQLEDTAVVVAKALTETNGLLWQQKPMIVCYGKQQ
ncbi:hypothetical protein ACLKA7_013404 [Drosophila subpalustris]